MTQSAPPVQRGGLARGWGWRGRGEGTTLRDHPMAPPHLTPQPQACPPNQQPPTIARLQSEGSLEHLQRRVVSGAGPHPCGGRSGTRIANGCFGSGTRIAKGCFGSATSPAGQQSGRHLSKAQLGKHIPKSERAQWTNQAGAGPTHPPLTPAITPLPGHGCFVCSRAHAPPPIPVLAPRHDSRTSPPCAMPMAALFMSAALCRAAATAAKKKPHHLPAHTPRTAAGWQTSRHGE
jgi:hypothetical protein